MSVESTVAPAVAPTRVEPSPAELPLTILCALVSAGLWFLAVVTIIGIVYAVVIGLFFFVGQIVFISHVRGSAVKVGPDQFPELHQTVDGLSRRFGLRRTPDAYIMEAGGSLNALATKLFRTNFIIIFSDLLDACGDNRSARDMIIAHEIGHIRAGHLRWHWLLLPSMIVPFLGTALSRAREYTCDRYGLAGAGDRNGALLGLCILAAGAAHGPKVNRHALVRQRDDLQTGWMTIGEWLSTHPPLAKRVAALDPQLAGAVVPSTAGLVRALGIFAAALAPVFLAGVSAAILLPRLAAGLEQPAGRASEYEAPATPVATERAHADFERLAAFIEAERTAKGTLPSDTDDLYVRWLEANGSEAPRDPFDGLRYLYQREGAAFRLISSGPDQVPDTPDDVVYDSRVKQ